MIPYLRIKGANSITCNSDLIILDGTTPILISIIDYGVKTKKVVADIIKSQYSTTIQLEDREDNSFVQQLSLYSSSYNFKSDRQGELTHTIIRSKRIKEYIIDWNNEGKIKSIVNYIRNVHYLPVTNEIVEQMIINKKYILEENQVYSNNSEFKDLKCYKLNIYAFKQELENINIEGIKDDFDWNEIETIEDYIFKFLTPITDKIKETVHVLFDKNKINEGIFDGKKKPFKGQIPIIQSGIEVLKFDDYMFIGADMGCGKTLIATKANHNYFKSKDNNNYTTLIVAPAITLSQWKDEIKDSISDKVNIVTIKKTEDFIKWNKKIKSDIPTYLLIGKETFKLSYAKTPSYKKASRLIEGKEMDDYYKTNGYYSKQDYMYSTRKRMKDVLVCPDCGTPLKNPNRTTEDVFFEEKDFKTINKGNYKCSVCNTVLWSACYNKTKKTSVIDYIHRKNIVFNSVIVDEIHESANSSSIIGNATRTLLRRHCKKAIALSGTSNNGYASSLHNFLMAVCPKKLKEDDCIDIKDFVQKYGTLQAVTNVNDDKRTYYSRGKAEIKDSDFREIEGINPVVFTKYLANNFIFSTLDDLSENLPKLKEMYIPVEANIQQMNGENGLFNDIKEKNAFNAKMYIDSVIKHYLNNPYKWNPLPIVDKEGCDCEVQPINLDLDILPKEEKLIELVNKEYKEGRKVWIYTEFNNGGNYMKGEKLPNRLERLLKAQGLKVFQLRATVSTYDRKEVIEANKDKYDVFISNPRIVNVGINLQFCASYIFYMPSYFVNIVAQASKRGYRINSTLDNRIYHMYYVNTCEDIIIKRFQRKLAESKAINGQFNVTLEDDSSIRTASQFSSKLEESMNKK